MPSPVTMTALPPAGRTQAEPFRLDLADGTYVELGWELRDGQPIVSVTIGDGRKTVTLLASPAQAAGWMADILDREGASDLADAFRRAARQAMRLRLPRQSQRGGAADTARSVGQRRAAEHARKLTAAAGKGLAAVAELSGCPGDADAMYPSAFDATMARIHDLLAVIEQLAQAGDGLKEWSTTGELCAWLGIEAPALYWLNSTGQGPRRHRIGKWNRYRRGDVEKWLVTRALLDG